MFGKNPKRKLTKGNGTKLEIQDIFYTLQGEGPYTGWPAVFIRLGGCNLACSFCDTEFESFTTISTKDIIKTVQDLSSNKRVNLVVITGGEPLRQPIEKLCASLIKLGYIVQIETNGTLYRKLHKDIKIICSPKNTKGKYMPIRPDLLQRIDAFKFLISSQNQNYNDVPKVGQSECNIPVYVQALDECDEVINKKNLVLATQIALTKGYRLSIQLHKIIGVK